MSESQTTRLAAKAQSCATKFLDRFTGFPVVTMRYRADWRVFRIAHQTILALIEDSPRGERARRKIPIWFAELDK